jgi:hypothetical protein
VVQLSVNAVSDDLIAIWGRNRLTSVELTR